ncbi:MAG: hypothetical protein R3F43_14420 [bacterium]
MYNFNPGAMDIATVRQTRRTESSRSPLAHEYINEATLTNDFSFEEGLAPVGNK